MTTYAGLGTTSFFAVIDPAAFDAFCARWQLAADAGDQGAGGAGGGALRRFATEGEGA